MESDATATKRGCSFTEEKTDLSAKDCSLIGLKHSGAAVGSFGGEIGSFPQLRGGSVRTGVARVDLLLHGLHALQMIHSQTTTLDHEDQTNTAVFYPDLWNCPECTGFAKLFSFFGKRFSRVHGSLCCPLNTFFDLLPQISATDLLEPLQSTQGQMQGEFMESLQAGEFNW